MIKRYYSVRFETLTLGWPTSKTNTNITEFSKEDESAIDLEIQKLLAKCIITKCEHETGEYISPIFIR